MATNQPPEPQQVTDMLAVRAAHGTRAAARHYNVTPKTVWRHAQKTGLSPLRNGHQSARPIPAPGCTCPACGLTDEPTRIDIATEMYNWYRDGATIPELARQYQRTNHSIRALFRRRGWPICDSIPAPRLDWEPLAQHLPGTINSDAHILGVDDNTIKRYRTHGVPADQADRLAVHAGLHPYTVWGDTWRHALDDLAAARHAILKGTAA